MKFEIGDKLVFNEDYNGIHGFSYGKVYTIHDILESNNYYKYLYRIDDDAGNQQTFCSLEKFVPLEMWRELILNTLDRSNIIFR